MKSEAQAVHHLAPNLDAQQRRRAAYRAQQATEQYDRERKLQRSENSYPASSWVVGDRDLIYFAWLLYFSVREEYYGGGQKLTPGLWTGFLIAAGVAGHPKQDDGLTRVLSFLRERQRMRHPSPMRLSAAMLVVLAGRKQNDSFLFLNSFFEDEKRTPNDASFRKVTAKVCEVLETYLGWEDAAWSLEKLGASAFEHPVLERVADDKARQYWKEVFRPVLGYLRPGLEARINLCGERIELEQDFLLLMHLSERCIRQVAGRGFTLLPKATREMPEKQRELSDDELNEMKSAVEEAKAATRTFDLSALRDGDVSVAIDDRAPVAWTPATAIDAERSVELFVRGVPVLWHQMEPKSRRSRRTKAVYRFDSGNVVIREGTEGAKLEFRPRRAAAEAGVWRVLGPVAGAVALAGMFFALAMPEARSGGYRSVAVDGNMGLTETKDYELRLDRSLARLPFLKYVVEISDERNENPDNGIVSCAIEAGQEKELRLVFSCPEADARLNRGPLTMRLVRSWGPFQFGASQKVSFNSRR